MSKMEKSSARSAMLVLMAVMVIALALPVESKDVFKDCSGVKNSMYCFGSMMVQNGLKRLASEKSLQIAPGLEVVETASQESADEGYRSFNEVKEEDSGVLARVSRYLANHELKINLSEMMRKNELQNVLKTIQDDMVGEMQGKINWCSGDYRFSIVSNVYEWSYLRNNTFIGKRILKCLCSIPCTKEVFVILFGFIWFTT